jgi:hypothetical protein
MHLLGWDYYQDKPAEEFGLDRTATLIKAARAEVRNHLLFDNGDLLQGNPLGDYMAKVKPPQPGQVHPAYKVMGSRAAYTLATALFVGGAGVFGYFEWIFFLIPKVVILPILVFVGLEITSQSFHATPRRHFPAVALACVPALAYLAKLNLDQLLAPTAEAFRALRPAAQHWVQTVTVLSGGGGFIVTSLLWATVLTRVIDGRMNAAVRTLILASLLSLFGVIHSPLPSSPVLGPSQVVQRLKQEARYEAARYQTPYHWAAAYLVVGLVLAALGATGSVRGAMPEVDPESHATSTLPVDRSRSD